MPWDPSNLQVKSVHAPGPITTADTDVKVKVTGAGFGAKGEMFGTFVRHPEASDPALGRNRTIPCNSIEPTHESSELTLRICPREKDAGKYDLILWLWPPPFVKDKDGNRHDDVPVNDVVVFPGAITVVAAAIPALEDEPGKSA
jgi:hypothetical protein